MLRQYLLDIAIILFITKLFGLLTRRVNLPSVVGALLAGVIMGPTILNIIKPSDLISALAEIGVILLMFTAGMETDLSRLKQTWKSSLIIAAMGVLIPLIGGLILAQFYGMGIMQSIFIGVILTATSVSITVETLQELKKIKTPTGTAIMGAAVIDDILGIIILTVIIAFSKEDGFSVSVLSFTLLKIAAFLAITGVCGFLIIKWFKRISMTKGNVHRLSIFGLAFCILLSFAAEQFGIADITGAYFAGLILCNSKAEPYIESKTSVLSYMFFSPIFFASIGIKTVITGIDSNLLMFMFFLLLIAIFTKVIGCGFGAKITKYSTKESIQIGIGMVSRGEVALIVADKGIAAGLMNPTLFCAIICVVIVTDLLTPIMLKGVHSEKFEKKFAA